MSWCAVLREHGVRPPREPGQIYVANHTSVIDVVCMPFIHLSISTSFFIVVLLCRGEFSLTGQAHGGLIGFFQKYILACMGNLWFDRYVEKNNHLDFNYSVTSYLAHFRY